MDYEIVTTIPSPFINSSKLSDALILDKIVCLSLILCYQELLHKNFRNLLIFCNIYDSDFVN